MKMLTNLITCCSPSSASPTRLQLPLRAEINRRSNTLPAAMTMCCRSSTSSPARVAGSVSVTFSAQSCSGDGCPHARPPKLLWKDKAVAPRFIRLCRPARHGTALHRRHPAPRPVAAGVHQPDGEPYKRLVPRYEVRLNLVHSQRNRSACVRIPITGNNPKAKRLEFRCPDSSGNPPGVRGHADGRHRRHQEEDRAAGPGRQGPYELPPDEAANILQAPTSVLVAVIDQAPRPITTT